jgi:Cys-tRNA(Pro)/Cys-tRNA(Cys) deacylase
MIAVKELKALTGYIRGGCSPLGMKKEYPIYIDESCMLHNAICISAGLRGLQISLTPKDLLRVSRATTHNLIKINNC